jgi:hypothetical protein
MEMGQPKKYFMTASTKMKTRRLPSHCTSGTLHLRRPPPKAVTTSQLAVPHRVIAITDYCWESSGPSRMEVGHAR